MAIDLYLLLKIPRESSPKGIEQAIDMAQALGNVAEKLLVTARKVLLNPSMRKEYDRRLAEATEPQPQATAPVFQPQMQAAAAPAFQSSSFHEQSFAAPAQPAVNPYRTPQAEVGDVAAGDGAVEGKLFTVDGIGIATFLGSVIAGGILLAHNYRRLGEPRAATVTLGSCIALLVAVLTVTWMLPDGVSYSMTVPQLIIMILYAKSKQGERIKAHRDAGGEMASSWKAAGIGLLTGVGIYIAAFVVLFLLALMGLFSV